MSSAKIKSKNLTKVKVISNISIEFLNSSVPTYYYSERENIYSPKTCILSDDMYNKKKFYDIVHKNNKPIIFNKNDSENEKSKKRLQVLFNHYGKNGLYFD